MNGRPCGLRTFPRALHARFCKSVPDFDCAKRRLSDLNLEEYVIRFVTPSEVWPAAGYASLCGTPDSLPVLLLQVDPVSTIFVVVILCNSRDPPDRSTTCHGDGRQLSRPGQGTRRPTRIR